jgi:CheY-like chemotaxis protein
MLTVMVVDDEHIVRYITARMLQEAGYVTIEMADGLEAWNYLMHADTRIDAILSDVVMPRITGTELVARLRYSHPDMPVALMSAYSAEELRVRGLGDCPVPLLTKPFDRVHLVALVHSMLDERAAPRRPGQAQH